MSSTFFWIAVVETFFPLIPIAIYWHTRKQQHQYIIYVVIVLALSFLADLTGMLNSLWLKVNNLPAFATFAYDFFAAILLGVFYVRQFPKRFRIYGFVFILGVVLTYLSSLLLSGDEWLNHNKKVAIDIEMIVFCLAYFYFLLHEMPSVDLMSWPMFWITTGLLIYNAGTIMLLIVSDYILKNHKEQFLDYWILHNLLLILSNILISIGFWRVKFIKSEAPKSSTLTSI